MTVEVSVKDVVVGIDALKELVKQDVSIGTAMKIKNFADKADDIYKMFDEKRNELIVRMGEETDGGDTKILPENVETFSNEVNVLLSEEIELDMDKISISALENVTISATNLTFISWMIDTD